MSMFWDNAREIMKKKKIKQIDLIPVTGKSRSGISAWITRDIIPNAEEALNIADHLGVSVRFLVTGKDDRELSTPEKELLAACEGLVKEKMDAVISVAKAFKNDVDRERGSVSPDTSVSEVV